MRLTMPALLLLTATTLRAQAPAPPAPAPAADVPAQLARMNVTLEAIAKALQRQVQQQELSIAMSRIETTTFLLVDASNRLEALVDTRDMLRSSIEANEQSNADVVSEMTGESGDDIKERRRLSEMMERSLTKDREQLKSVELRVVELQNLVAGYRSEIARFQAQVDDDLDAHHD